MKKEPETFKKKLIINYYRNDADNLHICSEKIIKSLKDDGVSTIFVVSFKPVKLEPYMKLVHLYKQNGLQVRTTYIDRSDAGYLNSIMILFNSIYTNFSRGNSLLLFNGSELSGALIACFILLQKPDIDEAKEIVGRLDKTFLTEGDEKSLLASFSDYLQKEKRIKLPQDYYKKYNVLMYYGNVLLKADTDFRKVKQVGSENKKKDVIVTKTPPQYPPYDLPAETLETDVPAIAEEKTVKSSETLPESPVHALKKERIDKTPEVKDKSHDIPGKSDAVPHVKSIQDDKAGKIPSAGDKKSEPLKKPETLPGNDIVKQDRKILPIPVKAKDKIQKAPFTSASQKKALPTAVAAPAIKGRFYRTIRFKLISIISIIIIFSLSCMIFLATYFFKKDNMTRIQEKNLQMSNVVSMKVRSDFESIMNTSKIVAKSILANKTGTKTDTDPILNEDRDLIFVGIAESKGADNISFIKSALNIPVMDKNLIKDENLSTATASSAKILYRSFSGETVVHNVSQAFNLPVLAISSPLIKDAAKNVKYVLVSYMKLESLLKAFAVSDLDKVFMVNEQGDILAHPESSIILSGGNYANIPIVREMITGKSNNAQTRYKDDNGVNHLGSYQKLGIAGCGVIATVEEAKAYQAVYDIQRRNIYLMIIVLTIAIMIVFYFGNSITNPILKLLDATKEIKSGNYRIQIRPSSGDEIGELTTSFIEMGKGLEEREKMKTAFGKFVNPEIAEMILRDEIRLGGERKNGAVLFSDIRSFTSISEKLEPEEVVEFLNQYMTRMVDCIDKTGGVVDKFIGDAIMALWGVPLSKGNNVENALNGALMMRRSLLEFNKDRGGDKKPIIKIGCGINSGPVLAGQIGSENRMEYTVIGDTVNLASRIESLNKPFGTDILVSEESYNTVKDIYSFEKMQSIKVKGKEKPQQIFAVLGRLDDPERPKTIEELRKLLDIEEQPFQRRHDDEEKEEVKYEIIK